MVSSKTFGASAIAVIGLVQMCPAPIEVVAAVIGGVVSSVNDQRRLIGIPKTIAYLVFPQVSGGIAGGISAGVSKRAAFVGSILKRDLPPGVSQESIDMCQSDINAQFNNDGTAVNVYSTSDTCTSLHVPSIVQLLTIHSSCSCRQLASHLHDLGDCAHRRACPGWRSSPDRAWNLQR